MEWFNCGQDSYAGKYGGHIETKTRFPLRDFYEVRKLEIHSTQWTEEISRSMGQTNKRLQLSELHFDKFPTPQTFFVFENEVQDGSVLLFKFPCGSHVMYQRSRDGYFSGWSKIFAIYSGNILFLILSYLTRGLHQHWTRSSKIPTSRRRWVWRNRRVRMQTDSFAEDRSDGLLDLRLTLGHWRQRFCTWYADLSSVVLRNDNIQEFDTRWDEMLRSMQQFPPDDILESLYKLRRRVSEELKTVLELYNLEIHQRGQNLIITDWRQWSKEVLSRIWGRGILKPEMGNWI